MNKLYMYFDLHVKLVFTKWAINIWLCHISVKQNMAKQSVLTSNLFVKKQHCEYNNNVSERDHIILIASIHCIWIEVGTHVCIRYVKARQKQL